MKSKGQGKKEYVLVSTSDFDGKRTAISKKLTINQAAELIYKKHWLEAFHINHIPADVDMSRFEEAYAK